MKSDWRRREYSTPLGLICEVGVVEALGIPFRYRRPKPARPDFWWPRAAG